MRKIKFAFMISMLLMLFSCKDNGDKFVGNWTNGYSNLKIEKFGDNFNLTLNSGTGTAVLENGSLKTQTGAMILYNNGQLSVQGQTYTRK